MSQNLVSMSFSSDQLVALDTTLATLAEQLSGMVALTVAQRRSASKMGAKSEAFCRLALNAMAENPAVVPPGVDLVDAKADLEVLDQLRPRFQRLRALAARSADTELALGSDVMVAAREGYGVLRVIGRSRGLESLSKELGQRFVKAPRQAAQPETAAA
jgi:hypothetical protein